MVRRLILLTLAVLSAAFGQGTNSKQKPRSPEPPKSQLACLLLDGLSSCLGGPAASLYVEGAELKIGMKKADVLSKLGGLRGGDVEPILDNSGELHFLNLKRDGSMFATIQFDEGAVSRIFRTDHDYSSPEVKSAFKDLWDALHAINEDEKQTVATVSTRVKTFTVTDPPRTLFDIWISFPNGKTVHLSWFSTSGASIEQQLSKPPLTP